MGVDAKYVYYTNDVGVEMTELQYNKMLSIHSERYVSHMSQEEFDSYKDANIISSEASHATSCLLLIVYNWFKTSSTRPFISSKSLLSDSYKDANIISSEAVYYKTTYENGVVVKEETISEEEYKAAPEGAVSDGVAPLGSDSKYVETSYIM